MSQHVLPHLLSPAVLHPSAAPLLYLYQACCCLPPLILFIIGSQPIPPRREGDRYLCNKHTNTLLQQRSPRTLTNAVLSLCKKYLSFCKTRRTREENSRCEVALAALKRQRGSCEFRRFKPKSTVTKMKTLHVGEKVALMHAHRPGRTGTHSRTSITQSQHFNTLRT